MESRALQIWGNGVKNKVKQERKGRQYYRPFWLEWTAQQLSVTVKLFRESEKMNGMVK